MINKSNDDFCSYIIVGVTRGTQEELLFVNISPISCYKRLTIRFVDLCEPQINQWWNTQI
jgi:hypothetical protein